MKKIKDTNGIEYKNIRTMCAFKGIAPATYYARKRRGWAGRDLFEGKGVHNTRAIPCKDHTGREFPSERAMCSHWNILITTYGRRKRAGWTMEARLTRPGSR